MVVFRVVDAEVFVTKSRLRDIIRGAKTGDSTMRNGAEAKYRIFGRVSEKKISGAKNDLLRKWPTAHHSEGDRKDEVS